MTKTRDWFRSHSFLLEQSFSASALIEHRGTKGASRESQILDVLSVLLPQRVAVLRNGTIIDSTDTESPKFDALLADRQLWPLLFQQDTIEVAMIESVLAAMEIKSDLAAKDLSDIFRKTEVLRNMKCAGKPAFACPPIVVAFAYRCSNLLLSFFDFAANFQSHATTSPSVICVLNSGLLFLAKRDGDALVVADVPSADCIPVLAEAGPDSLLQFLYFWFPSRICGPCSTVP